MAEYQILVSEHGSHLPEKWAVATASQIFPVEDAHFTGAQLVDAHRKQLALIEVLAKHHGAHQSDERAKLKKDKAHITLPLDVDIKPVMQSIIEVMQGSQWQDHFTQPDVQAAVEQVVKSHTLTNRYTERSWHADRNPDCPYVLKFKESH